ncbi:Hsp70 family protein [Actinokineospora sp. G85]|uniref:Hsp70 family protein n=1 Tax=Actinokineospora sp. G85 TaxID=3406626 RepID=UPI003C72EAE3
MTAVIDFGTSHTVAVVGATAATARVVPFDGAPWLPSAVFLSHDGTLVAGADALRFGAADPARLERGPKARVDDGEILLGDRVVPVVAAVRAVVATAARAAAALAGAPIQHLVLTHPADWGPARLGVLLAAAQGLAPRVGTTPEPVAAAAWYARDNDLPVGAALGVLDFGGGTCDAAVVRRAPAGIEVVACAGLPDLGGEDVDQRVADHLLRRVPGLRARFGDETAPGRVSPGALRELVAFRDDVRAAKELLSRHPQADVVLPRGLPDTLLTREEFDALVGADLDRAVALVTGTLDRCGATPADLVALQLVGGSSRIPRLGQALGAALGRPIRLDDQPETVVALGAHALSVAHHDTAAPPPGHATGPITLPAPPRRAKRWPAVTSLVVAVLLLVGVGLFAFPLAPGPAAGTAVPLQEKATLPAPVPGSPLVRPGSYTSGLTQAALRAPAPVDIPGANLEWTVNSVLDPADRVMLDAGADELTGTARYVLADVTYKPLADLKAEDVVSRTALLDDRDLRVLPLIGEKLPPDCPAAPKLLPAGQATRVCLPYLVSVRTPIKGITLSDVREEGGPRGAFVPAAGSPTGQEELRKERLPLGTARPIVVNDKTVTVSVVDVVTEPSAYFDYVPVLWAGTRAVLVRAVADAPDEVDVGDLSAGLLLRDDRGQAIPATLFSRMHGCTAQRDGNGVDVTASGELPICLLFILPSGVPLDSARWFGSAADAASVLWEF